MRAIQIIVAAALLVGAGCGSGSKSGFDAKASADASTTPDGGVGPDASCFTNPQTHYEIINACTTAQSVDKTPVMPLQYSDGGLPPLPQ